MLGFRIWDCKENEFISYPRNDGFAISLRGSLVGPGYNELFSDYTTRFIPMQSTGLKDCNEVEIFEGDILKILERKSLYAVHNVIDFLFFFKSKVGWYNRMLRQTIQFEIIGNIYENPELLEKIK